MNALASTAKRLVSAPPHGPATPLGTRPPPGITLAARTPWFDATECAGHRTVRWEDGVRLGVDPMTTDTHHDLASVTKVVGTTTALMRLVSDRIVDLDTAVNRYLPGFRGGGRESVTVRDLLLHRGGLWEWYPLYIPAGSPEAAHRFVEELPLRYRPREERHYSDLGFMLLGRIVASAAGLSLEQAVSELATRPLGLDATRYASPAGEVVATGARDDRVEITMVDSGRPYPVPHRSDDFAGWRHEPVHARVADGNTFHAFGGVCGHAGSSRRFPICCASRARSPDTASTTRSCDRRSRASSSPRVPTRRSRSASAGTGWNFPVRPSRCSATPVMSDAPSVSYRTAVSPSPWRAIACWSRGPPPVAKRSGTSC